MAEKATTPYLPEDLADWKKDLRILWLRVLVALNKAVALVALIGIHKGLDITGEWLVPEDWQYCSKLLRGSVFAAFTVIYVHVLWEMVKVFIPGLRAKFWGKVEK